MDDKFLYEARRDPRPEFAEALRMKLQSQGAAEEAAEPHGFRWFPTLAAAAAVACVVALITIPSVRASAQAFLDLFRVRNFAAVSVDPERLAKLNDGSIDVKGLLSDRVETLQEPGPEQTFDTPEAAGAAAGLRLLVPSDLPEGFQRTSVAMRGPGAARLTVDAARLREVVDALGLRDVTIPPNLDGAKVEVRMPAAIRILYRNDKREVVFLQARSPEMSLPSGLDIAQLGEIGLRIAGLEPAEARRFARSIDWHSTLLVPVPSNASAFNEVEVHGRKGLLITTTGTTQADGKRSGSVLMWSEGDQVYALCGNLNRVELVQMANSVR
jgi:hypothetical protein